MQIDVELNTVVPHADQVACGFTAWLEEHPHSYSCLVEAIYEWLDDEGAPAEDTGYSYEAWLEAVIYIIIDWSMGPERYQFHRSDGEQVMFSEIVVDGLPDGKFGFLNRSFYLVQCAAAKLHRLGQLHRD